MAQINAKINPSLMTRLMFPVRKYMVRKEAVEGKRNYSNSSKLTKNYRIRNITEADIPRIADIRKSLKLPDCLSSLYSFHKLDPEAIVVAEDSEGHIIGTHSMMCFAQGLYVTGLTYVHRNYRSNKLAVEMIRLGAVRHRRQNRLCVGVVFEGWVKKLEGLLGFQTENGIIFNRHISSENVDYNLLSDDLSKDVAILPFEGNRINIMNDYDMQVAGCDRRRYLELSCHEANNKTLIAVKDGRCVGFGTIKLSCVGAKRVGPLYADDPKIAEALLKYLLNTFQDGTGVVMIVPSPNLEAQKLVNKLNIPFNDNLYHFYENDFPQADVMKAYAHFDVNGSSI